MSIEESTALNNQYTNFNNSQIDQQLYMYRSILTKLESYILMMRGAYFCAICDFDNQQYFNYKKNFVTFNNETCMDVA